MDKEMIIDGINVAGCKYFRMNNKMPMCRACNSGEGCPYCEYEKDCYYKQLQRLKQENERLRKQYNCYACDTCSGKEDYRNMKRHCENAINSVHELRRENEQLKELKDKYYVEKLDMEAQLSYCIQALEELKKEIQSQKGLITTGGKQQYALMEENKRLKEEISIARENYGLEMEFQNMYRQALEEIRAIAKEAPAVDTELSLRILEKINEVLDER